MGYPKVSTLFPLPSVAWKWLPLPSCLRSRWPKPCLLRPALGHSSFCYLPVTPATNCIFRKQLRKQQFPSPSLLSGMKLSSDISFPLIPPKGKQYFPQQFCVSSWVQQASCMHPSPLSVQCEIISPLLVFIVIMKRVPCRSSPVSLAAPAASQTSFVSFKFFWVPNQSQV